MSDELRDAVAASLEQWNMGNIRDVHAVVRDDVPRLLDRLEAMEAAARKVMERFMLIPNSDAPVCMYCDTFVWPHAEDCPIGVFETLLAEEP